MGKWLEAARRVRAAMDIAGAQLDDATALEAMAIYPAWIAPAEYATGDRRTYNNELYKCVQAHTSQADWAPDVTPALWVKVSVEEYPNWIQPTGAHDAYSIGDKVTFEGARYVSLMDANIHSPIAYPAGWQLVTE